MKLKICLMGLLCLFFRANAQFKIPPDGLKVGDRIPDLMMGHLSDSGAPVKFSNYPGKLLILDFWATWCTVCIEHFADIYDLQKKFNGRVEILLINSKNTRDAEDGIHKFFSLRSKYYHFNGIVGDTLLSRLFPHHSLPHYVIVSNDVVLAITDADQVNEANLNHFLADSNYQVRIKNEVKYDPRKLLFVDGNGGNAPKTLFRSMLTGPVQNLESGFSYKFAADSICGFYGTNVPLRLLYQANYPTFAEFNPDRVLYRVPGSNKFFFAIGVEDIRIANFTYEVAFPPCGKSKASEWIWEDLDRYFHLKIDSQYIDTTCFVVKINQHTIPSKANISLVAESNLHSPNKLPKYLRNLPLSYLLKGLEHLYKLPFLDETGYQGNLNLVSPGNLLNEKELRESLARQGFILSTERKKVKYLVFTTRTSNSY
ncbi:MAG: resA 1 [Mucilaginibacter sp.]|nr:resA 1 [Mucilaginibacter sp.]